MTTRQTFGSALRRPWALVRIGSNCPIGRRPATEIVYLTDDESDHYLGGVVSFYRGKYDPTTCWHYSYKHAKRIPKADVLHIFASINKSRWGGPSQAEIRRARKALPVTSAWRCGMCEFEWEDGTPKLCPSCDSDEIEVRPIITGDTP